MIDPQACARHLILNDPALAEPLLDLLVWVADQPDIKENSDYDEILDMLWLKLQASREARDRYAAERIQHVDRKDEPRAVEAIAAAGSSN